MINVYYVLLCSVIGAGIWYHMNPVSALHDTRIRNRRRENESI